MRFEVQAPQIRADVGYLPIRSDAVPKYIRATAELVYPLRSFANTDIPIVSDVEMVEFEKLVGTDIPVVDTTGFDTTKTPMTSAASAASTYSKETQLLVGEPRPYGLVYIAAFRHLERDAGSSDDSQISIYDLFTPTRSLTLVVDIPLQEEAYSGLDSKKPDWQEIKGVYIKGIEIAVTPGRSGYDAPFNEDTATMNVNFRGLVKAVGGDWEDGPVISRYLDQWYIDNFRLSVSIGGRTITMTHAGILGGNRFQYDDSQGKKYKIRGQKYDILNQIIQDGRAGEYMGAKVWVTDGSTRVSMTKPSKATPAGERGVTVLGKNTQSEVIPAVGVTTVFTKDTKPSTVTLNESYGKELVRSVIDETEAENVDADVYVGSRTKETSSGLKLYTPSNVKALGRKASVRLGLEDAAIRLTFKASNVNAGNGVWAPETARIRFVYMSITGIVKLVTTGGQIHSVVDTPVFQLWLRLSRGGVMYRITHDQKHPDSFKTGPSSEYLWRVTDQQFIDEVKANISKPAPFDGYKPQTVAAPIEVVDDSTYAQSIVSKGLDRFVEGAVTVASKADVIAGKGLASGIGFGSGVSYELNKEVGYDRNAPSTGSTIWLRANQIMMHESYAVFPIESAPSRWRAPFVGNLLSHIWVYVGGLPDAYRFTSNWIVFYFDEVNGKVLAKNSGAYDTTVRFEDDFLYDGVIDITGRGDTNLAQIKMPGQDHKFGDLWPLGDGLNPGTTLRGTVWDISKDDIRKIRRATVLARFSGVRLPSSVVFPGGTPLATANAKVYLRNPY